MGEPLSDYINISSSSIKGIYAINEESLFEMKQKRQKTTIKILGTSLGIVGLGFMFYGLYDKDLDAESAVCCLALGGMSVYILNLTWRY
jgi:uncharacterized protein involved in response to NO